MAPRSRHRRPGAEAGRGGLAARSVLVASALVLGAAPAQAQGRDLPLELWLGPCEGVDGDAVRRMVAVELGAEADPSDGARATVSCDGGAATILVRGASGVTLRRQVDLETVAADVRARLLALHLVEAVAASRVEGRRPTAPPPRAGGAREPPPPRRPSAAPRAPEPGSADLAGLEILEREVGEYGDRTRGYLATVDAIARREYERRVDSLLRAYDRRIAAEEARLRASRRRALAELEVFVVEHGDDPVARSFIALRLAELSHEEAHASGGAP